MKIDITKEQYELLVKSLSVGCAVLGILGDSMPEKNYKKVSVEAEELQDYLLQYAKGFGCNKFIGNEKFEGKDVMSDEFYETKIMPILSDYDGCILEDSLSSKLAWRDFRKDHTEKELKKMAQQNNGYFGGVLYDYEKKYWDEIEAHGYERFVIKED